VTGDWKDVKSRQLNVESEERKHIKRGDSGFVVKAGQDWIGGCAKCVWHRLHWRHVTSFDLLLVEADLPEGATKVPVQVVLPAYLHRKMRNVKLQ
jgi:hypothetical protein